FRCRQPSGLERRNLVEHSAYQRVSLRRIARPVDSDDILRPGKLLSVRIGRDAVGTAELLTDRIEQPRLQDPRTRPQRQFMPPVVFQWPGKHERYFAFRRYALFDRLLDDAGRQRDAEVAPGLVRMGRRQAGEVGFDHRTDRIGGEAADEDE